MCEILAVTWPEPRPFAAIAPWAKALEFYGSARFGWGVAWTDGGQVKVHKDTGQAADDPAVDGWLGAVTSRHFLVHFRRPTLLSTIQLADTQPFLTQDATLAFCHNGLFSERDAYRPQYEGRLRGGADSEIGFLMLTDLVGSGAAPVDAQLLETLPVVAGKLGGNANLGTLAADGSIALFTRHETNKFWTFNYGTARVASTEMHSPDGSLFRLIFPGATDRSVIDGSVLL
jgi:predicted glutamine amidotransferase